MFSFSFSSRSLPPSAKHQLTVHHYPQKKGSPTATPMNHYVFLKAEKRSEGLGEKTPSEHLYYSTIRNTFQH